MAAQRSAVKTNVITPPSRALDLDLWELWSYRELLYFLTWRDIKVKYKQTIIGAAWAVVQPLVTMVVYTVVFGEIAGLSTSGIPGPVFYFSGLVLWIYFANSLGAATNALVNNQALITKIFFPRILLPFSSVVSGLVDFVIAFVILIGLMLVYDVTPSLTILMVPVFVLLTTLTALGVGLWLSSLNAVWRDVKHGVPFLIQIWMFASLVVFAKEHVPQGFRWIVNANPMAAIIEGFRWSLTGTGDPPDAGLLLAAGVVGLLMLTGVYFFNRTETVVVDVV